MVQVRVPHDGDAHPGIRGVVRCVRTGNEEIFRDTGQLVAFLRDCLVETPEVDPACAAD